MFSFLYPLFRGVNVLRVQISVHRAGLGAVLVEGEKLRCRYQLIALGHQFGHRFFDGAGGIQTVAQDDYAVFGYLLWDLILTPSLKIQYKPCSDIPQKPYVL